MNKKDKIIIIVISALMVIFSIVIIYNIIKTLKYIEGNPKDIQYRNKINDNIEYLVHLKPNDYIVEESIGNNFSYITQLVEYIETSFNYEYITDYNLKLNYKYSIVATMIVDSNDQNNQSLNKPILKRDFILLEEIIKESNNSKININETLNISLDYYNSFLEDFINSLNLASNSRLEIKLLINIFDDSKILNKFHDVTLSVPLGVKTFNININKNFVPEEVVYKKEQKKPQDSYVMIIFNIVLFIIINTAGFYIIKSILNKYKSKYKLEKEKILKEYDDRIVTVVNFINYENIEVVDVVSFNELLEFSNEAFEPIIYWERKIGRHKEAWFSILRNRLLYRYIIHSSKTSKTVKKD